MNTKLKLAAVAAVSAAALSAPALAEHAWGTYHWKKTSAQANPPIYTAISSSWQGYVDTAVADWNRSSVIESPGPTPAAGVNPKTCKVATGQILVCNSRYGQTGWLGIAQIWLSSGHIAKGLTKLNDTYFNMAQYNTPAWKALVTCQEIGHDYGLGHQDEDFNTDATTSCMDYTSLPEGNEHPDAHDYEQLELIYDHTESNFAMVGPGKSGSRAGAAVGAAGGDTPADWGRAVDTDAQGRPHVFVQDLGGGNRKITHVFWAIGEGPGGRQHDDH